MDKLQFSELLSSKSDDEQLQRDAQIIMDNYLSEIEYLYQDIGLNRKELAMKIGTSDSYLSQVFCGKKPLNFLTLAKIKKALNLRFETNVTFKTEKKTENTNETNNPTATPHPISALPW